MKNKVNCLKIFKIIAIIYAAIIVVGITCSLIFGLQLDINFKGGTRFTYTYTGDIDLANAKTVIESKLSNQKVNVTTSEGLNSSNKKMVVTLASDKAVDVNTQTNILKELQNSFKNNKIEIGDSNSVNPTVAGSFFLKSLYAVLIAGLIVLLYVGIRFRKIGGLSAGVTALLALILDCLVAFFVCVIFKLEIDTNFMAVILTILGYSLNDTIVIYDRIRENNKLMPGSTLEERVNTSLSQCLGRSIMTSVTTLIAILTVVVVSEFFGLTTLRSFAIPMAFGIVSGCVSSLFIAVPTWLLWQNKKSLKKAKTKIKSNRKTN